VSKRSIYDRGLKAGDVLVNSTGVGTLGRTAQIWEVDETTVVDSHITVMRADADRLSRYYLGLDLTSREAEIEALGEGSTGQTELARSRLAQLPLLQPSTAIQSIFDDGVRPLIARIGSNQRESWSLTATRDLLLPKLMSGELRVRDAEKITEVVL
jgi:type I restriction enzyme S subunit